MKQFFGALFLCILPLLMAAPVEKEIIRRADTGARVLMIGIDGATWEVIDPLIAKGELPNLKKLIDGGVRAKLKSLRPLFSPAIWTSMATGKMTEDHGIKDFHATRNDLEAKRIWDVISESGRKVGVFGWLVTWPPDSVNGFIVPSWLAHGTETHPMELSFISAWGRDKKGLDLEQAARFGLSEESKKIYRRFGESYPKISANERPFRYRMMELPVKTDLFLNLYRRYDPLFAAYVTTATDHVSHLYWKYYQPDVFADVEPEDIKRYGQYIPDIYKEVDAAVGRLFEARGENTAVFVVSDHGFRPSPGMVNREIKVESLLEKLGWKDVTYVKLGGRAFLDVTGSGISREEALSALGRIAVAASGEPVFTVSDAPGSADILIEIKEEIRGARASYGAEAVTIEGKTYPLAEIMRVQALWSGTHALYGVLIMNGPPFKAGIALKEASVLDIAPTVMETLGYPVAADLAGRVLVEAFKPEFLKNHPIRSIESYGPATKVKKAPSGKREVPEDVKKQLKSLGYL